MGKERGACFRMDARLTLCANMILDLSLVAMTHGRIQVRFLCFSCFHFIPELSYSDCGSSARSPVYRCPMALNPSRRAPQPEFVQKDYPRQAVGEHKVKGSCVLIFSPMNPVRYPGELFFFRSVRCLVSISLIRPLFLRSYFVASFVTGSRN